MGADGEYWAALAQGQLKMQRCDGCSRWNWPAVWRCGECGSWAHSWHALAPRGRIFSWTRTWHDFGAPPGLAIPYVSVVVELDDAGGTRLLGTLDTTAGEPAIGLPVTARLHRDTFEGDALLAWRWSASPVQSSAEEA